MKKQLPIDTSFSRLPISVITGFLGSGKTTLLNRLLQDPQLHHTAVVINEFGAVGIDHLLVRSAKEDVIVMDNGCLCCTIKGDLVLTLQELFVKRTKMEVPEFDRVIIETTGLADPGPLIHTLMDSPILTTYFRLDNVITTVDGVYGLTELNEHYETVKQIAVAEYLIVTKTDLVKQVEIEQLKQRLQVINPAATLLTPETLNIAQLFSHALYHAQNKSLNIQKWLRAEAYVTFQPPHQSASLLEENTPLRHDQYIQSFCIEREQPLHWKTINQWFQQLTALRGKDLLRIKGILYTVETDLPVIVQGVQHMFQPPTTLPAWPENLPRRSQIVFITRNIKKTVIEQMLEILINSHSPVEACAAALLLLN